MFQNAFQFHLKWAKNPLLLVLLGCVLGLIPATGHTKEAKQGKKVDDIRVLIDISGSMKRTDPQNLRIPALRLFTTLLPQGAKAGVWSFGRRVNQMVPHGPVDASWKKMSLKNIGQIDSSGLFTDIEQVLERATQDWQNVDELSNRHILLLSDGLVDISKRAEDNSASRKKIVEKLLPRLEALNVKINTIALSGESDRELLHILASASGGWFETIENADGLERLFLKMFEKVSQADSLPLKNNLIKIDKSIKEVTFLVFRKTEDEKTSLTTPSKKIITLETVTPEINWYQDKRFELITVKNPDVGSWKLNTAIDPDNRAMVVTDLQLSNTELPNSIEAGMPISFQVHLEEDGKMISRKEFLSFVRVSIRQTHNKKEEFKFKLKDNGKKADNKKNDGIFTIKLDDSLKPGDHDIEVIVNGTTFKRNKLQRIKVYDEPVRVTLKDEKDGTKTLAVVPYKSLIDSNSMTVLIKHKLPSGDIIEGKIPRISPIEWLTKIDPQKNEGEHEIILHIIGNRPDGSEIDTALSKISFIVGKSEAAEIAPENTGEKEVMEKSPEDDAATSLPVNWMMVSFKVGVFNLLLLIIGFALYKFSPAIKELIIPGPSREAAHG